MRFILMIALVVAGAVLLFMGGAALAFGGARGGVAGAAKDLVFAMPAGELFWANPWAGVAGGIAVLALGVWLSRA